MITLIGFYNYDSSIFDGFNNIDGIDKNTLVNTILLNYGEMKPLYEDPKYIRMYVKNWVATHKFFIDRAVRVLNEVYEPLENYNRVEEWEDDGNGTVNSTVKDSTGAITQVSPDNGNGWYNDNKTDSDNNSSTNGETTSSSKHKGTIKGNIGVMTSQAMLKEELEVARINLYNELADMFANDLLLKIY